MADTTSALGRVSGYQSPVAQSFSKNEDEAFPLVQLPEEIIEHIFSFLKSDSSEKSKFLSGALEKIRFANRYIGLVTRRCIFRTIFNEYSFQLKKLNSLKGLDHALVEEKICEIKGWDLLEPECRRVLKRLNLSESAITDEQLKDTLQSSKFLKVLNLRNCKMITDGVLESLPESLTDLNLSENRQINDLSSVAKLSNLTDLSLAYVGVTDTRLTTLSKLPLTTLNLSGNAIIDEDLAALPHSIRLLDLSDCHYITDVGLRNLLALKSLKILFVRGCRGLSDEGVKILPKSVRVIT